PDGLDVAALLAAQQISSATQFQIERRYFESCAQIAELLERRQPPSCQVAEFAIGRNEQIGIGPAVRAAHASAQLVQLRKPVPIGAVDDDGVAQRNVEAILDDGGRN